LSEGARAYPARMAEIGMGGGAMEVRVERGGRITIPPEVLRSLGLEEGDVLELEVAGRSIVLRSAKRITVDGLWGLAGVHEVDLEDVEDALGRDRHGPLRGR